MVSLYLYVLLLLTDFLGENPFRIKQGTALVVIIMTNVVLNFIKFFYGLFKGFKNYLHKKRMERLRVWKIASAKKHIQELL